jgi:hypothetical protein
MHKILAAPGLSGLVRQLVVIRNTHPESMDGGPEFPQGVTEFIRVKNDPLFAVGTDDVIVTLEPTERLVELVNAAAGEGKLQTVNPV